MNNTSRSFRFVRMPIRSAPRSREGPAVVTMAAPISLAMMVASVVFPNPGGPDSRTWSSGSRRWRAASTEMRRLSTAARCPTYSSSRWGRSCRSTCVSSGKAMRLITRASSFMGYLRPISSSPPRAPRSRSSAAPRLALPRPISSSPPRASRSRSSAAPRLALPRPISSSPRRAPRSRSSAAPRLALPVNPPVDLIEELFGRRDAGPAAESAGDELGRLARPMAELLDHHLEHHPAQPLGITRASRGGRHRNRGRRTRLGQRELRHLGLELGDDVLGLLRPDAGQPPQVGLILTRDGGCDIAHRGGQRARRHQRPHILHRDELLEELLVQFGGEPDQDGTRLALRGVIMDLERHLLAGVTLPRRGIDEGFLGHRRDEDLVAHPRRLDHNPVLELSAQPAADGGDHRTICLGVARPAGSRPVMRAMPVTANPRASATWDGRGRLWSPRRVCTAR